MELVRMREARPRHVWAGIVLAAGLVGSAAVAWVLLARTPNFAPGLAIAIAAVTIGMAVVLALPAVVLDRRIQVVALVIAVGALLAAPAAYAVQTVQSAYGGGDPSAGPAVANGGGPGSFGGRQGGVFAGGQAFGGGGAPGAPTGGGGFGAGGPGDAVTSSATTDYLAANQGSAHWIVAVSSANQAGSIELATGLPVMAMGGFSGGDPTPTLEQLRAYVASGALRFVIVGGGGGPGGGSSEVSSWVTSSCATVTSVSSTLYDCVGVATGG
jgi:lysylphosphatidylglycerol synthetase-like protein (DUF2156 family)